MDISADYDIQNQSVSYSVIITVKNDAILSANRLDLNAIQFKDVKCSIPFWYDDQLISLEWTTPFDLICMAVDRYSSPKYPHRVLWYSYLILDPKYMNPLDLQRTF